MDPRIAVVIPTYNRAALLRRTLHELTRQSLPAAEFEVVVADDGSTDDTKAVVDEFGPHLRIAYHYQEDLGFRAGTARNAGARLSTAPVLVFLDTGAVPGPRFVEEHLRAHPPHEPAAVCLGYSYGYNPDEPMPAITPVLARHTPEETLAHFGEDPAFRDLRHESLEECGFDLHRRHQPWSLTWTVNCSVPASDFHAVGGFDETFVGWGAEDLEWAFRLHRRGLGFRMSMDAWVIETPTERDWEVLEPAFLRNMYAFLDRHPEPEIEIGVRLVDTLRYLDWDRCSRDLARRTAEARGTDVAHELRAAAGRVGADERVAVFGCGGVVPAELPPAELLDFDRELLDRALADGRHTGRHALGVITRLPDDAVDVVVLTSRLDGPRAAWNDDLLAEARRVGRRVVDLATP